MGASLLHYRPWRGDLQGAGWSVWPIARVALGMLFRRKLFWVLYGLGLMVFFLFFFGQYLLAWAQSQLGEESLRIGVARFEPGRFIELLSDRLKLNGSPETYRNFFWYQGYMVMIILAMAGSILVGNDFHFGSLPFYLSKPLGRWQYVLGKCLAVAVFVNLMTTLPAVVLFVEYGFLYSWDYFVTRASLLAGILGYGLLLTVSLSLILVATATWLRRTVPMIMVWTTLFFFLRLLAVSLVDGLRYDARWRLIDLWYDTYLLGSALLGMANPTAGTSQPELYQAALVLGATCLVCLGYVNWRIRAVEIVR
jgi:ABC-2 type transport system permease protein